MKLFLARHGQAVNHAQSDSARMLTSDGRYAVRLCAQELKAQLSSVQKLVVSPYLRAQQTAEILIDELGWRYADVESSDANQVENELSELLIPSADVDLLVNKLYQDFHHDKFTSMLLVSHLPLLDDLLNTLCGLALRSHHFATSSVASLSFDVMAKACCECQWIHMAGDGPRD